MGVGVGEGEGGTNFLGVFTLHGRGGAAMACTGWPKGLDKWHLTLGRRAGKLTGVAKAEFELRVGMLLECVCVVCEMGERRATQVAV